jgi:hypothetical protein
VDGRMTRTLLSGKLLDVGPTSTPAYTDSSAVVLRSLASHFDAPYDEVAEDAKAGTLSRYWERTDNRQPALVESRSESSIDADLDLRRKLLDERGKRVLTDRRTPAQLVVELNRRKMNWDTPADERRSLWTGNAAV